MLVFQVISSQVFDQKCYKLISDVRISDFTNITSFRSLLYHSEVIFCVHIAGHSNREWKNPHYTVRWWQRNSSYRIKVHIHKIYYLTDLRNFHLKVLRSVKYVVVFFCEKITPIFKCILRKAHQGFTNVDIYFPTSPWITFFLSIFNCNRLLPYSYLNDADAVSILKTKSYIYLVFI
jgi:hypothetical protein